MGRHTQQIYIHLLTLFVARLEGVFLLVETQRTVATQLNANRAVETLRCHVCRYLFPRIKSRIGGNSDNGHGGLAGSRQSESCYCQHHPKEKT